MSLIQSGNKKARTLVVGEAPGADEIALGKPFVGMSGREFDRWLGQSGWNRRELFITNVCQERPPKNEIEAFFTTKTAARKAGVGELAGRYPLEPVRRGLLQLQQDIDEIRPTLILALGNTPLWALTGQTGILKWRGSTMAANGGPVDGHGIKLVCTLHPAFILRGQSVLRPIAIADLKRAKAESLYPELRRPNWSFTIPHTPAEVADWFASTPPNTTMVSDVENIVHDGSLICLGFASSPVRAMCVPFIRRSGSDPHWWHSTSDETIVANLCRVALRQHPICFHNGLHDCQIIARQWGMLPSFQFDTMVAQHVAFPGMLGGKIDPVTGEVDKKGSSLSLSFCASLYCDSYRFWKNDGRTWEPSIPEDVYWAYNCEDCVRTYEVMERLHAILKKADLWDQYLFEMSLFPAVFEMMFRGVAFDDTLRRQFQNDVEREAKKAQAWLDTALGHPLNVGSSKQMKNLFYNDLQCDPILHRKTKQLTLDDKALERLSGKHKALRPFIERIQFLRTLGVFRENFLEAKLRPVDGRLCGAFNVASPETFRFSSNVDAFGSGLNLQNLPRNAE